MPNNITETKSTRDIKQQIISIIKEGKGKYNVSKISHVFTEKYDKTSTKDSKKNYIKISKILVQMEKDGLVHFKMENTHSIPAKIYMVKGEKI